MGKDRASDHKTIRAHKNLVRNLLNSVPDYIQKVQCDTNANTPPFRCAVVTCTNFFDNYKLHQKAPYKFHNFPFHNLVLANKWLEICGLSSDSITGSLTELKVCSDHFELDDYVRNYRQEIFNPNFKRRLFDEAIPHVKVPKPHETSSSAANIISWTVASRSVRLPKNVHQVHSQDRKPNRTKKLKNSDTPELTKIIKQKEALEKDIATLTTSLTRSKKEVSNKRQQLRKAKEQVRKDTVFKLVEKGVFTKAQVKFLLGRKKVIWSDDDYAAAFTLRHVAGKEAYLYMKNELVKSMDEKKVGLEQVVKLLRENKAFLEGEIERNREVCEKLDKRISAVHKRNTSQEDWAMLRKTFSSKQVQHFQSKFKRVSGYSDDDHAISWTLHNLMRNRRSYECIRYNMQIPLPNRSKISRWRRQNRKRTEVDGSKKIQEQDIISEEHQHSESEDQDTQI